MGQADLSMGDGTLTPAPGLAAILTHGMDFFDRPSGVVIPQFASSLAASLGNQSADGTQDGQAPSADENATAPGTTTSSRDYDQFSDPVASLASGTRAYDGFSDVLGNTPQTDGGSSSGMAESSQLGQSTNNDDRTREFLISLPFGDAASYALSGDAIAATADQVLPTDGDVLRLEGDLQRGTFQPSPLDSYGRGTAQTFSAGLNHKLYGAMVALRPSTAGLSIWERYRRAVASQDNADELAAKLNPKSFLAGQATGIAGMAAVGAGAAAVKGGAAAAGEIGAIVGEDAATGAAATAESTGATGALAGSAEAGTAAASAEANAAATSVESGATAAEGETASNTARTLADEASAGSESSSAAEGVAADDADANPGWRELNRAQKKVIRDKLKTMFNNSKEVVYEFSSAGLKYVGQTSRGYARMIEHLRTGKLHPKDLDSISFQEETGGKFAREVAETKRIKELGGLESTANINWPVSSARLPVPPITP